MKNFEDVKYGNNKLLKKLSKKDYLYLIFLLLLLFSIIPTFTAQDLYSNDLIQFITYYSIGAYFNLFKTNYFSINKNSKRILFLSLFLIMGSIVLFDILGINYDIFNKNSLYFLRKNSFLVILLSISIFSLFINKLNFTNKIINNFSPYLLGVYLISDNQYLRKIIWIDLFKNNIFIDSNLLIIHMFKTVFIVFIVCIVIDYIRQKIIEEPLFYIIGKKVDFLQEKLLSNKKIYGGKK